MHTHRWRILMAAVLLASTACAGGAATAVKVGESSEAAPSGESGAAAASVYEIGDVIEIGNVVFTVTGWRELAGGEFDPLEPGMRYVGVDILLVNASDRSISVNAGTQGKLKDASNRTYSLHLGAHAGLLSAPPNGELSPGERIRGTVSFQIPDDASGLEFSWDVAPFAPTGKSVVVLGAAPHSVAVPASLPGESGQQSYAIGDVVEIGRYSVVVNGVTFGNGGGSLAQPSAGNEFVFVDITVTNTSNAAVSIATNAQARIKDSTGLVYTENLAAAIASTVEAPRGELAPGETVRGTVAFHVPQSAGGFVFIWDAAVWGFGKVHVAIGG